MRLDQDYAVIRPGDMEPLPGLPVLIPLVAVSLSALPQMNDVLYMSPYARKSAIGAARNRGYKIGLAIARAIGIPVVVKQKKGGGKSMRDFAIEMSANTLTELNIFCVLHVWHERSLKDPNKGNRKRDVYNPVVKATVDGLTDAGLWVDDSSEYHTDFWVTYRGLRDKGEMRIEFYGRQDYDIITSGG